MDRDADERLMALLQGGDVTALETLFARHAGAMYGFFYRTTGSIVTGEDLTQDVFLRILRYRASFRPGKAFRVWLYRIARNVLADHRARRPVETTLEDLGSDPPATGPLPSERLERIESRELVRRALARLSDQERELLMLSRFHDLRHAELADLFDCTTGAVKVRVHRALKRFAAEVATLRAEARP